MKRSMRLGLILLTAFLIMGFTFGCRGNDAEPISQLIITNGGRLTLEIGSSIQLKTNLSDAHLDRVKWSASNDSVTIDETGLVTAVSNGKAAITATYGSFSDSAMIEVVEPDETQLDDAEKSEFYSDYKPADSYEEACVRSEKGLMSGSLTVPDQAPDVSEYRPKGGDSYIRNEETLFEDSNTYVVVDAYGNEAFTVYRGGAYITLEEVAAYVYAFGDVPANYLSGKDAEPENSIWGEYLRLNHSAFSGNTEKYPYEPVLPDISGCGGALYYYEIDIGTTGTDCDPRYLARIYNDGQTITRGAARIVYARYDENRNAIIEPNERYLFYTYNHYNDFQEYLNYEGGWGELFGNITGGGSMSSKTDYNPTAYVPTVWGRLGAEKLLTIDPNEILILLWHVPFYEEPRCVV